MSLERFYDEYADKVYKFFYIKLYDRMAAEDLTSQTFTLFVGQADDGLEIEDPKKYLYGIMRNVWLQFLRKKYDEAITDVESIEDFEEYSMTEVRAFDRAETAPNRLLPYIKQLPEKQRVIIEMRFLRELSIKQIAIELNKDRNYVKTTYKRAIKSLRVLLEKPYMEKGVL